MADTSEIHSLSSSDSPLAQADLKRLSYQASGTQGQGWLYFGNEQQFAASVTTSQTGDSGR